MNAMEHAIELGKQLKIPNGLSVIVIVVQEKENELTNYGFASNMENRDIYDNLRSFVKSMKLSFKRPKNTAH